MWSEEKMGSMGHMAVEFLSGSASRDGSVACYAFALYNARPVFPVACYLGQNVAHDLGTGHETMLFAFEDPDFAFAH